jgi:hypothetical protein
MHLGSQNTIKLVNDFKNHSFINPLKRRNREKRKPKTPTTSCQYGMVRLNNLPD